MNGAKYRSAHPVPPLPAVAPQCTDPGPIHSDPQGRLHFRNFPFSCLGSRSKKPLKSSRMQTYTKCVWNILLCSSHTVFLLSLKQDKPGPTPKPGCASGVTLLRVKTPLLGGLPQPSYLKQPPTHTQTASSRLLSPRTFIP